MESILDGDDPVDVEAENDYLQAERKKSIDSSRRTRKGITNLQMMRIRYTII
jgi:hypothetical protein